MGRYLVMQKPVNDHSFEPGVLEQGNMSNVQDRGYLRTRVENHWSNIYPCAVSHTLILPLSFSPLSLSVYFSLSLALPFSHSFSKTHDKRGLLCGA